MLNPINKTIELADGRTITIETGKLAKQADGAVTVRMGNTVLLATVCAAKDANPGVDFMPLQVEYKEKYSAFGRFPGGFTKREGKASDYEILTSRLVDRALRPLFPDNYHAEVYVNVILFSADGEDMPDALAGLAASAALAVSDIPFNGPISEVRVARVDGKFIINPTFSELDKADIDMMVAATIDNIMMVEGEMSEVQESDMLDAIKVAHEAIKVQCQAQLELSEACGKLVRGVEKLQCRRGEVQLVRRAQFSRRAEAQSLLPVTGVHLRVQRPERRPLHAQTGHAQPASGKPAAQRLKPRAYLHRRGRAEYDEIQPCLLRLPYERSYALSGKLRAQPLQSLRQL